MSVVNVCDVCGEIIEGSTQLSIPTRKKEKRFQFALIGQIDICKYCMIDAVIAFDDRSKPACNCDCCG